MNSIKMAEFFLNRIQQTIKHKQHIKAVHIGFDHDESYGNEYVRVSYSLDVYKSFEELLSFNEQEFTFRGSPNYIFSLSTYTTTVGKKKEKNYCD